MSAQETATRAALENLAKWRTLFAGWQLGTRPLGDPECDAVRDHREATLMLRVESSALIGLLIERGVITQDEWLAALEREALRYNGDLERRFPGVRATTDGLTMDTRVLPWMKGWRP